MITPSTDNEVRHHALDNLNELAETGHQDEDMTPALMTTAIVYALIDVADAIRERP